MEKLLNGNSLNANRFGHLIEGKINRNLRHRRSFHRINTIRGFALIIAKTESQISALLFYFWVVCADSVFAVETFEKRRDDGNMARI